MVQILLESDRRNNEETKEMQWYPERRREEV